MRYYNNENRLEKVICNKCGRTLKVENGILKEGVLRVSKEWGYFSEKDGQVDCFDLCESCYDLWTASFAVSPNSREKTELLGV